MHHNRLNYLYKKMTESVPMKDLDNDGEEEMKLFDFLRYPPVDDVHESVVSSFTLYFVLNLDFRKSSLEFSLFHESDSRFRSHIGRVTEIAILELL